MAKPIELPNEIVQRLCEAARQAAQRAYAPYSNFRVGAAVWAGQQVYSGCNIENASYGLTICAERVAIFQAVEAGHRAIDALLVCCHDAPATSPPNARSPCGACRQVIREFSHGQTLVLVEGVGQFSIDDLLPIGFTLRPDSAS